MYAAMILNIGSVEEDGRIAYDRGRGMSFKRELLVFGAGIWYLKPGSAGKDKADERWGDLRSIGVMEECREMNAGKQEGIIKARRGEENRWRAKEIDEMVGVPQKLMHGRGAI